MGRKAERVLGDLLRTETVAKDKIVHALQAIGIVCIDAANNAHRMTGSAHLAEQGQ